MNQELQPRDLIAVGRPDRTATLVSAFLSGRTPRTLEAYRQDLDDFRAFVWAETLEAAAHQLLSRSQGEANALALAYKTHLGARGLSAATINRRLAALRSLLRLARLLGLVPWGLDVENVKVEPYRDTRGPGPGAFRRLLAAVGRRTDGKGLRDAAALRLLYDLALRRSEVVGLDLADVDLEAGTLSIRGKGRTQKETLTLPEPTQAALAQWLAFRGTAPGPLFPNFDPARKGGRLTGTGLYQIVRAWGREAGLKVRPHGLRHAAITEALDLTGGNVRAVQRFSRHRDLRVLSLYDDNRTDLAGDVARLVAGNV